MTPRRLTPCAHLALVFIGISACQATSEDTRQTSSALITDQAYGGGATGFFWLPPMVPQPALQGTFDGTEAPTVRIDELAPDGAFVRTVVTYPPSAIAVGAGSYGVNWPTRDFTIDANDTYRIHAIVAGRDLGVADVLVFPSAQSARSLLSNQDIALVDGHVLPVRFFTNRCAPVVCAAGDACRLQGTCNPDTGQCSSPAAPDGTTCASPGSHATATCSGGACVVQQCSAGWADCDGVAADGCEADLTSSATCGGCGTSCGLQTCCDGFCSDTTDDIANCGACGHACSGQHAAAWSCTSGACVVHQCDVGWADCNGIAADGCEADLTSSATCGGCGTSCGLQTCCYGFCSDTTDDLSNCGACGHACTGQHAVWSCTSGACVVNQCLTGWADCNGIAADGCEINVASGATCGGCGTSCGLQTCCSGFCADTTDDISNCGACGHACSGRHAAWSCSSGACVVNQCNLGWADCNGAAADGCEANLAADASNCGACGVVCASGTSCTNGSCM
jgi:hypothetical protein